MLWIVRTHRLTRFLRVQCIAGCVDLIQMTHRSKWIRTAHQQTIRWRLHQNAYVVLAGFLAKEQKANIELDETLWNKQKLIFPTLYIIVGAYLNITCDNNNNKHCLQRQTFTVKIYRSDGTKIVWPWRQHILCFIGRSRCITVNFNLSMIIVIPLCGGVCGVTSQTQNFRHCLLVINPRIWR